MLKTFLFWYLISSVLWFIILTVEYYLMKYLALQFIYLQYIVKNDGKWLDNFFPKIQLLAFVPFTRFIIATAWFFLLLFKKETIVKKIVEEINAFEKKKGIEKEKCTCPVCQEKMTVICVLNYPAIYTAQCDHCGHYIATKSRENPNIPVTQVEVDSDYYKENS